MHRCLDPPIATYLPGLVVALLLVMPLLGQQRHNGGRGALLGDLDAHEFQGVLPVEPVVLWAAGTPVIVVIVVVGSVNGPAAGRDRQGSYIMSPVRSPVKRTNMHLLPPLPPLSVDCWGAAEAAKSTCPLKPIFIKKW